MAWKLPFGGHQCVGGTENFPQLYLEFNDLILQHDSWNCGFAVMLMLLEVCTVWNNREGYTTVTTESAVKKMPDKVTAVEKMARGIMCLPLSLSTP